MEARSEHKEEQEGKHSTEEDMEENTGKGETHAKAVETVLNMRKAERGNERTFPSRQVPLYHTAERNELVDQNLVKPLAGCAVHAVEPTTGLYTRFTDPFNVQRVEEILKGVTIGKDISEDQRTKVENLICQYADIFALSVSKVATVDFASFLLNMPPEATFNMAARH
jgi:hypothetical protein